MHNLAAFFVLCVSVLCIADAARSGRKSQDGRDLQMAIRARDCGAAEGAPHHEVTDRDLALALLF